MFAINSRLQTRQIMSSSNTTNPANVTLSDFTGSAKLLVPGKVVSSGKIPQGATSMPINPEILQGVTDVVQISVGTDIYGALDLDPTSKGIWSSDVHWTRALRLADDCHSYNIQLQKNPHHMLGKNGQKVQTLVLQAVRSVEPGQELLLWFSEELLATLHMGFLTPANIQGQKNYVCTQCSALYESPNPLKLHLTLGCGKQTMTWLWEQLSNALSTQPSSSNGFHFKLESNLFKSSQTNQPKQKNAIDLSSASIAQLKKIEPHDTISISSSAFKPFKKGPLPSPITSLHQNNNLYNTLSHWPAFSLPNDYAQIPYHLPTQIPRGCNDDAQIETLVSSLGKYKEGHICLYCGKSYSRKYGLKIHIRTHTGYKPLKCKFCLRPFGDPSNLNKHVRLHAEGETPYKCEICGKVLVRRRDLERHMRSRHSDDMEHTPAFFDEEPTNFTNSSEDEQNSVAIESGEENSENIDIEDNSSTTNNNE